MNSIVVTFYFVCTGIQTNIILPSLGLMPPGVERVSEDYMKFVESTGRFSYLWAA